MARMIPDKLLVGTHSNAERKVFYALKELLPERFTVLHHLAVYRPMEAAGGLLDGEIDYLLLDPEHGVIVIEVKGGGIIHNSEFGEWFSVDAREVRHRIKDPFEQAKAYKYFLRSDLRECMATKRFSYPIGHAVWFPDVDLRASDVALTSAIRLITLDSRDLASTSESICRLVRASIGAGRSDAPGPDGVEALVRHLAPSWRLVSPLSAQIQEEDRQFREATDRQYRILSILGRVPRALISGCAGAGKTLLAVEKARRLSSEGERVLLLCFNKNLANWIQSQLPSNSNIDALHFHAFCAEMCRVANVPVPTPDPVGETHGYFEYDLPEALMDALEHTDRRYDAIIVDEGQDFLASWWVPILESLANPNDGTCYIFFDDNQAIYDRGAAFPFAGPTFQLFENCRNTQLIQAEVGKFYKAGVAVQAIGPEGRKAEYIPASDEIRALKQVLHQLVAVEGIRPSEITVLTPLSSQRSKLREGEKLGTVRLSWTQSAATETVSCSTIHAFKGLESSVVILVEMGHTKTINRAELWYVGMSRAKSHLVVILPPAPKVPDTFGVITN